MEADYSAWRPVEADLRPTSVALLHQVYSIYARQFGRWFCIVAPTSVLASLVLLIADDRIREIFKSFPLSEIAQHGIEVAQAWAWRFGSFFLAWLLGCFALAAIASVVNGFADEDTESSWHNDAYQKAREHIGALLLVALFTFIVFLVGMVLSEFIESSAVKVVGWVHYKRFAYYTGIVGYVVVASIVSWFGMAIPLIVTNGVSVWSAVKKSLELSGGFETFLFFLVIESVAGSFAAWYAVHDGLTLLLPAHFRHAEWYGWTVYGLSILAAAAIQPPMFIGFSLIAAGDFESARLVPRPQQSPHVN